MLTDLRPLRDATFRHLAGAYWINEFGEWIGDVALALLVYDRTNSPLATAALFLALRFAPALVAQVVTSRVSVLIPRRVLPALYAAEAVIFTAIAVVAQHFSLPAVLVLCAADGIFAVTAKALTRSASATHLLPRGTLREGNAILNLGVMLSGALGPALGGLMVAWAGASTALLLDVASFVAAAVLMGTARGLRVDTDEELDSTWGRLRAGLTALRARPTLGRLMVAIALVMMLGSIVVPIEVVFVKHTLHGGDTGYGELLAAWGVGMTIGGLGFAAAKKTRMTTILAISTILIVLGYSGMAGSPTLLVACLFAALGGIGNGSGWIGAVTAVQGAIPSTVQSQTMAVLEGINRAMPALGFMIGGALTALSSPRVAFWVSAAGVALVVLTIVARPLGEIESPATSSQRLHKATDYPVEEAAQ